jgi:hydroxyacylglutathione hydrolase
MLSIEIISALEDNYCYIIYEKNSNLVGVIDPSEFEKIDKLILKKYKKLDFILNTHHHFDHVGGNIKLKEKYSSKIVGSEIDRDRIPGIDFCVKENDSFKFGEVSFKVIFIPGHTKGHIAFYSEAEKIVFTGDTLFSMGCGRIFEGSFSEMFNSLNKLKKLPKDTQIYCGHEYTKSNFKFCKTYEPENKFLLKKKELINDKLNKGLPTIPVTLEEELKTNIFLRCDSLGLKDKLKMNSSSEEEVFKKLRILKDKF